MQAFPAPIYSGNHGVANLPLEDFDVSSLKQMIARNYYTLMYLLIAGSFLGLVAELVWTEHWDGIQLVGLLASAAGMVLIAASGIAGTIPTPFHTPVTTSTEQAPTSWAVVGARRNPSASPTSARSAGSW